MYGQDCFPCSQVSRCLPVSCPYGYSQPVLSSYPQSDSSVLTTLYLRLLALAQQSYLLAPQHEEPILLLVLSTHLIKGLARTLSFPLPGLLGS